MDKATMIRHLTNASLIVVFFPLLTYKRKITCFTAIFANIQSPFCKNCKVQGRHFHEFFFTYESSFFRSPQPPLIQSISFRLSSIQTIEEFTCL